MDEYKEPYLTLFRAISKALAELEHQNYGLAKEQLLKAQQNAEDQFISGGESC